MKRIPAARILVPFALGIVVQQWIDYWWIPLSLIVIAVGWYAWGVSQSKTPAGRLKWRTRFIMPLVLTALSLGWLDAIIHEPPRLSEDMRSGRVLVGRVVYLDYTDFSMRLAIDVLDKELPPCRVLVSTRGCDYAMQAGDLVAWPAHLSEVDNLGNPEQMDYAGYLLDSKGIRYQQHLPLSKLKKVGHSPTLMTRMASVRRSLRLMVYNSHLSTQAQHFTVALLLGDSHAIDQSTRQEFSAAGVAHVLALSGLHVGIIAAIIWWLLFPLDYLRLKKLRLGLSLAAIVLFAAFTGMSPSVLRATVMIGFVFASLVFYRRSVSLNALAMAALVILVFTPAALRSVGFQLSFITVGAILLFARVPQAIESRHRWVNYLTSTVITSLVAMLATVALTAHYFHVVSLMSVLANLLILPVLPILMVLGTLFLLVTAAGQQWQALDWCIDTLCRYINWATGAVNAVPGSHIAGVYVSTVGVVAYFAVLTFLILWFYCKDRRYLLAAGCALILMLGHSLWLDLRTPHRGAIVFNSFTSTPVLYYENGKGYVWVPDDDEPDSAAFTRYYAGLLARYRIDTIRFITDGDTLRMDNALIKPPIAHLMGHRMVAVGRGKWKHASAESPLTVDDIIVTKRFHGSAANLLKCYHFDRLILSGAHYETLSLKQECDSLHIPYHDLSSQGALEIR